MVVGGRGQKGLLGLPLVYEGGKTPRNNGALWVGGLGGSSLGQEREFNFFSQRHGSLELSFFFLFFNEHSTQKHFLAC